jgi:integrase
VSASTLNQAFNALLFLYRYVLQQEFGKIDGAVRAKCRPYIPVVFSREEIEAILSHLSPPVDLVVKLLYGGGLRLFECLYLHVQCLDFDAGKITIHDGKGKKDRTVPLPTVLLPELKAQLHSVKELHRRDLANKYVEYFLLIHWTENIQTPPRNLSGNGFFRPRILPVCLRLVSIKAVSSA